MPPKPVERCEECGKEIFAEAYDEGEAVHLAWACGNGCTYEEIDWPFYDEFDMTDLTDLGFVAV